MTSGKVQTWDHYDGIQQAAIQIEQTMLTKCLVIVLELGLLFFNPVTGLWSNAYVTVVFLAPDLFMNIYCTLFSLKYSDEKFIQI